MSKLPCRRCHGTGRCWMCRGSGKRNYRGYGKSSDQPCSYCQGTGVCRLCRGKG
ncbi:hypothetical protein [Candidatus Lokiarchaeum ossiferum]